MKILKGCTKSLGRMRRDYGMRTWRGAHAKPKQNRAALTHRTAVSYSRGNRVPRNLPAVTRLRQQYQRPSHQQRRTDLNLSQEASYSALRRPRRQRNRPHLHASGSARRKPVWRAQKRLLDRLRTCKDKASPDWNLYPSIPSMPDYAGPRCIETLRYSRNRHGFYENELHSYESRQRLLCANNELR